MYQSCGSWMGVFVSYYGLAVLDCRYFYSHTAPDIECGPAPSIFESRSSPGSGHLTSISYSSPRWPSSGLGHLSVRLALPSWWAATTRWSAQIHRPSQNACSGTDTESGYSWPFHSGPRLVTDCACRIHWGILLRGFEWSWSTARPSPCSRAENSYSGGVESP